MSTNNLVLANGSNLIQIHQDHKYPPVLLDGFIQPADLHIWEQAANHYFTKNKIADNEKVTAISPCFHGLGISIWIDSSKDAMTAEDYTFSSFMTGLREQVLEPRWARKIHKI